jgi:hypothetical protein
VTENNRNQIQKLQVYNHEKSMISDIGKMRPNTKCTNKRLPLRNNGCGKIYGIVAQPLSCLILSNSHGWLHLATLYPTSRIKGESFFKIKFI